MTLTTTNGHKPDEIVFGGPTDAVQEGADWLTSSAICVLGHRGSGKGALSCHILDHSPKPVYVFGHPTPQLVEERGWKPLWRLEELYRLGESTIWIDEGQLTIPKADKKANDGLNKLLSIARHRSMTLLLSTCDSRWVTRALESMVDVWLLKDCEAQLLKNGSMAKKLIRKHVVMDPDEFRLEKPEYLFYSRDHVELDGLHVFDKPDYFDDRWSKPWAVQNREGIAQKLRQAVIG
jgi:hypothetical protein